MRKPILAGNWKMNKTVGEAVALVEALKPVVAVAADVEVVVAPPFTALWAVRTALRGSRLGLAAQDMFWGTDGAFTGEVSPTMLTDVGCSYVIIAHSERRQFFGETNETANRRLRAARAHGLKAIYCVGETLDEREAGATQDVVRRQIELGLVGITGDQIRDTVIAYEPVWAIGTGRTATPEQAQEVHAFLREVLAALYDPYAAEEVRIQYGGSVKPDNIEALLAERDIDGALVGGASLDAASFGAMIRAVAQVP
jgi:triosephosphate isomerase